MYTFDSNSRTMFSLSVLLLTLVLLNFRLLISAETSVTCHGGYSYLKCENSRIQINTANYGRTDKTTCSEGRPNEQLQNSNCYSPNALAPVSKSCNGLESCEVFATHTVFTDPCFGIYKYLAISYYCLPPGVRSSLVCEHETSAMTCDDGTVIRIHSANYGRTDSTTCSTGRPASQLAKTDCYALNSQTVVTSGSVYVQVFTYNSVIALQK
ncbi:hypothetical protein cypCar_00025835 [Cyprinus carpio]|nr:hypothetical protein cypCar_00025835 [Cyprinus carpio]